MVLLVDLSALEPKTIQKIARSDFVPEEVAVTLLQTKKLDYGAIKRKKDLLNLLTPEWQKYIVQQFENILSLHKDAIFSIFLFFQYQEFDVLALVCKEMKDFVERFAEKAIKDFKKVHPVDSTWRDRLRQFTECHGMVTNRHELQSVSQVYMYKTEIDGCVDALKLPGRNEVLVKSIDGSISVRDLKTKQNVRVLRDAPPVRNRQTIVHTMFVSGDFIFFILYDLRAIDRFIRVWTVDGNLLHDRITLGRRGRLGLFATLNDKLYFTQNVGNDVYLVELNVSLGSVTRRAVQTWHTLARSLLKILAFDSWILMLIRDDLYERNGGVFVVDRTDLATIFSRYLGDFSQMACCGNNVAVVHDRAIVDILSLNDGSLEARQSINLEQSRIGLQSINPEQDLFRRFLLRAIPNHDQHSVVLHDSHLYVMKPFVHFKGPEWPFPGQPPGPVLIHRIDITSGSSIENKPFLLWTGPTWNCCSSVQVVTNGERVICCSVRDHAANQRFACVVLVFPK